MQTAAAYIRVSTEDQTEYSPDSQRKKIREYARAHALLLPESLIFQDEGISGRSARKRPAFLRMIGMAKQKPRPFDLILVWKFSRFARSRQDSILYKSMLRKDCGIDVISITEQLSDDPTSILIEALLEAMDEYYSINLAQEVRRGMNEKFSRGGVVSVPPFGYRMGAEYFEIDEEQAPFVRRIFQDFLSGSSPRQIAVQLNEWGVRTARGNPFRSRSIEYILSNPVYSGKLRRSLEGPARPEHDREASMHIVDGKHPPIIGQETFDQTQEQLSARKHLSRPRAHSSKSYMLHGLVRCSSCGSVLTASEQGRSLQCPRYTKGQCRTSHHIRLEKLNRTVLYALERDLGDFHAPLPIQPSPGPSGDDVSSLLLSREERRLERIRAAYEAGVDSLEEYQEKKSAANSRIQKFREEQMRSGAPLMKETFSRLQISFRTFLSLLSSDRVTKQAKNEALCSILSHVTFCRPEDTVQLHYRI